MEIFRKAALDRLASPEHLDAPVRLVGAPGWLTVIAFVVVIGAGALWAAFVEAPVRVRGEGILIDQAGLSEIVTSVAGRLESVDLLPGQIVETGQVVATLSQTELRRDRAIAEAKLADARQRYSSLEVFYAEQEERRDLADEKRRNSLAETRRLLSERKTLLDERVESIAALLDRQIVRRDRLIEAEVAASDVRERIAGIEEELLRLELSAIEHESERQLALLDERLTVEEQEREVERLTARLSDQQVILSSHSGRIAEVKVNAGDVVEVGTPLASLAPAGENDLIAVLYVPPAEGKRVEPGMAAHISPTTVEREVYGHIFGEVVSVAPLPATPEGMRRTLRNAQLVAQLSAEGAPIEVRVQLLADAATATGFRWSSSVGPDGGVNGGTLVEGRVVVYETSVINLIIPGATTKLAGMN